MNYCISVHTCFYSSIQRNLVISHVLVIGTRGTINARDQFSLCHAGIVPLALYKCANDTKLGRAIFNSLSNFQTVSHACTNSYYFILTSSLAFAFLFC